jgi:hypothetical protein
MDPSIGIGSGGTDGADDAAAQGGNAFGNGGGPDTDAVRTLQIGCRVARDVSDPLRHHLHRDAALRHIAGNFPRGGRLLFDRGGDAGRDMGDFVDGLTRLGNDRHRVVGRRLDGGHLP